MAESSPSFRSILVPLDGSQLAEQALPLAVRIAQAAGSKLRLVLVHRLPPAPLDPASAKLFTSIDLATRKSERAYLRRVQARLREEGVRLSSAVTLTGPVGPALDTYVRELGMDLVVMATHGRGGIRRAWLGSVADHLIRHLEVPVLLVRPEDGRPAEPGKADRILVPLDGSPLAEEALEAAVRLARAWDAEVCLLQIVAPVLLSVDPALPIPSAYEEELTGMSRQQAQAYLDRTAGRLREQGLRASGTAVIGWNAADAILDTARPDQVAMAVLATHGRGGVRRLTLGSVADKLVRGAMVPVLVYRPAGRGRKRPSAARAPGQRAAKERV
jgi:nucleotide-binding universal stress UspA family protein